MARKNSTPVAQGPRILRVAFCAILFVSYYLLCQHDTPIISPKRNDNSLSSETIGVSGGGGIGGSSNSVSTCVVMLLSDRDDDLHNAILAITSFDNHIQDNFTTPVLIFNEGNIDMEQQQKLANISTREIMFPYVNFSAYPPEFDPQSEPKPAFSKRSKFGYQQMCRFWITRLWTHEAVGENCNTVMRMDADSCFWEDIDAGDPLPGLKLKDQVYGANEIALEDGRFVHGLWDLTQQYVKENHLVPLNSELYHRAGDTYKKFGRLPSFYNNFEIARVSFFRREDVMNYQTMVTEADPFGVYRQRWGDAVVRYLTLALFAEPSEIDLKAVPTSYAHGDAKWARGLNRGCPGLPIGMLD